MQTHFSPMASKLIPAFALVLFCFLLMKETSGCSSMYACFEANGESLKEIPNRKVLSSLKDKKTVLKDGMEGSSRMKSGEKLLIGELRKVPMGPDPLHHHSIGNPIVKPQTP